VVAIVREFDALPLLAAEPLALHAALKNLSRDDLELLEPGEELRVEQRRRVGQDAPEIDRSRTTPQSMTRNRCRKSEGPLAPERVTRPIASASVSVRPLRISRSISGSASERTLSVSSLIHSRLNARRHLAAEYCSPRPEDRPFSPGSR